MDNGFINDENWEDYLMKESKKSARKSINESINASLFKNYFIFPFIKSLYT